MSLVQRRMALLLLTLLLLLSGCGRAGEDRDPGSGTENSLSAEELRQQLGELSGGAYGSLADFVEAHIRRTDRQLAGEMTAALLAAAEAQLPDATAYICGEKSRELQQMIAAALREEGPGGSVICAGEKAALMENLPENEEGRKVSAWPTGREPTTLLLTTRSSWSDMGS